jgi:hypothetical protein
MVVTIQYPANVAEWYARGTGLQGGEEVYFEVPAVFDASGACDVPATDAKVLQFLDTAI